MVSTTLETPITIVPQFLEQFGLHLSYYRERGVEYERVKDCCLIRFPLVQSSVLAISSASSPASPSLPSSSQLQIHNLRKCQAGYHCGVCCSLIASLSLLPQVFAQTSASRYHLMQDHTAHPTPELSALVAALICSIAF